MALTRCPSDEELHRLLAAGDSDDTPTCLEVHLETCVTCRARLDELSGAAQLPQGIGVTGIEAAEALTGVIDRLLEISPFDQVPVDDTRVRYSDAQHAFSYLEPVAGPGLLGRLGKYEIRHLLGQGGMGVVFSARDPDLNRDVAIKVPTHTLVATGEALEQFLREARAIASVNHPHIVTVHAVEQCRETPFLVMELVRGQSLAERIAECGALPWRDVAEFGKQVAAALAAAHAHGLVHRDIKPGNVLLERSTGCVKVTDFGLAKSAVDTSLTASGILAGTPEFMSPEQVEEGHVTPRADLFSLGTVLYTAAAGESPFRAQTAMATLQRVCQCSPAPLNQVNDEIPVWFANLVARLLAKRPADRIGSAEEVLQCLESGDCQPSVRATRQTRLRLWPVAAGFAALAAIVAGVVFAIVFSRPTPTPAPGRDAESARASGFYVDGLASRFESLEAAVEAAPDGGVIEILGAGPYLVSGLAIGDKELTIRAAKGFRPVLINAVEASLNALPFLSTKADLRLAGIEVRWSMKPPANPSVENAGRRCMIHGVDAGMTLQNCRLIAGRSNGCVNVQRGTIDFRDTDLVAASGPCCVWIPSDAARLVTENCVFDGRVGITLDGLADRRDPPANEMRLDRNTFSTHRAIQLLLGQPIRSFVIRMDGNLFDTDHVLTIARFAGRAMRLRAMTDTNMRRFLQSRIKWNDSNNVYRSGTQYVTLTWVKRPNLAEQLIGARNEWLQLWGTEADTSTEANVEFSETEVSGTSRLRHTLKILGTTGKAVEDVGARPAPDNAAGGR